MTECDHLVGGARRFLTDLAANNTRDWWQDHKSIYESNLKAPALALLDSIQPKLADLTGLPITTKLFRPHRDVRFSKDKTPYTTHLHMMWTVETGARQNVVFFFGIGRDYVTAGAGSMELAKPVLADWRKFVDLDTDRILSIMQDLADHGVTFREPALKRVPAPFDKDHRAGHLLRMKGVVGHCALPPNAALEPQLEGAFRTLWPLNHLLIQIAEA